MIINVSNKLLILIIIFLDVTFFSINNISAIQLDNLPKNRNHIRLYKNFGIKEEISRNRYDLSFIKEVKDSDHEHIALIYDLNTEMEVPSEKAARLEQWSISNGLTTSGIPEKMFLHFKNSATINLPLKNMTNATETRTVPGWDTTNPAASRIPSYYWGAGTADAPFNYAMNVGDPDYQRFMAEHYVPYVLNKADNAKVDGIYFDTAVGYWRIKNEWIDGPKIVEYDNYFKYFTDDFNLLKSVIANIPAGKIIIGNGWYSSPQVLHGSQWETLIDISKPFKEFKNSIDFVRSDLSRGSINLFQFNPVYHKNFAPLGIQVPVSRERDQIYALAGYYLAAGDRSYFAYGMHPYIDFNGELFISAVEVDVGYPEGDYYIFSEANEQEINVLKDKNGDFEIQDSNNDPAYWVPAEPVEIAPASDCQLNGQCVKIESADVVNNSNRLPVTLKPHTTYSLSGYIKTKDVKGTYWFSGANFYPYDFDDSTPKSGECGATLNGDTDWTFVFCTFTTGDDIYGNIYFRLFYAQGASWFDNIKLREGLLQTVLARKYSKALILVRPRINDQAGYNDPEVFRMHNMYRQVSADGSAGSPSNIVTLNSGEAAILTCTHWNGNEYAAGANCVAGDLDNDGNVNSNDLTILNNYKDQPASACPECDLDGNGMITDIDSNKLENMYTILAPGPVINNPPSPPSAAELVSPADKQTGLDTAVTFKWNKAQDPDGDTVTYKLSYCANQDFIGCEPVKVASPVLQGVYYASTGSTAELLLLGMLMAANIKVRKRTVSLIAAIVITGGILMACGGGSSGGDSLGISLESDSDISYTVNGLNPGTAYYWKVTAEDGKGGATESSMRSFSIK